MNQKNLIAFMIWAIETENLHAPITEAWEDFKSNAKRMQDVYTHPDDPLLYIPQLAEEDSISFFTDYVLCYAQMDVNSGLVDYGETINNYLLCG